MPKILFFNFDGTDNEPSDAMQEKNFIGVTEDNSITNILKIHLLLGGNLREKTGDTLLANGSRSFYYNGIGTYGNYFERKLNAGLANEHADVSTILRLAKKDFKEHFLDSGVTYDYIVVTGFSRGAALARRFASTINDEVGGKIIIEGVFDTVAAIGLPNMSREDRPTTDVVFEFGHTLPDNVVKALHLVSLDDKRKVFQPTLMNQEDRVKEVWFPGAHSDVGGGYNFDGLSDNALRFFIDWFEDQPELELVFKSSNSIDYSTIFNNKKDLIGPDDVQIEANSFGVNHQQDRTPLIDYLTLTDRLCCVIRDDKVKKDEAPLVHWSLAERVGGDRNYRPKSLSNTAHRICYSDLSEKPFIGYSEHKLKYKSKMDVPDDKGVEARIYAHIKNNHTGVYLDATKSYKIEVLDLDNTRWRDGSVKELDGLGWDRGDVSLGFMSEAFIATTEPFRRVTVKGVKWFTLCGHIVKNEDEPFIIGNVLKKYSPEKSGELIAFANDLDGYYGNNSGYLKIKVTLLS